MPALIGSPVTGATRSVIWHGLSDLASATNRLLGYPDLPGIPYDKAKEAVDLAMSAAGPRGGARASPPRILGTGGERLRQRPATSPVQPDADIARPPYVDSTDAPLAPASPPDPATAAAAARARGIDFDALSQRAHEIHGVLNPSWAQGRRTTAVLLTDGPKIIGGGVKDLSKIQRKLLRDDEIPAKLRGAHAEVTVLREAYNRGHRPRALVANWGFCPDCVPFIESMGGLVTSPTTAVFPPY